MSLNNTELFSYEKKKCGNLANSTFNLYELYIKLAQKTKQFRRLVLENFITVIHFLFDRLNTFPPLCQQTTSIQSVKYGNSNTDKSFCWHTGGGGDGGMIFLKIFSDFYIYFNVKLIVLPKILKKSLKH